jgi:hypothetical protein
MSGPNYLQEYHKRLAMADWQAAQHRANLARIPVPMAPPQQSQAKVRADVNLESAAVAARNAGVHGV